jgi:hypothetical protein
MPRIAAFVGGGAQGCAWPRPRKSAATWRSSRIFKKLWLGTRITAAYEPSYTCVQYSIVGDRAANFTKKILDLLGKFFATK